MAADDGCDPVSAVTGSCEEGERVSQNPQHHSPEEPATPDVTEILDEQEVDDTLDDTFPASDPPSWTLGVDEARRPDGDSGNQ